MIGSRVRRPERSHPCGGIVSFVQKYPRRRPCSKSPSKHPSKRRDKGGGQRSMERGEVGAHTVTLKNQLAKP
jgi:hypothetical protein